jgi:tetratricopeptide (TPR) repeat protein
MHLVLGNFEKAIALAEEANAVAKDPIYRDTSKLTVVSAALMSGDVELARSSVDYLRNCLDSGIQLPSPLFVDMGEAVVMMADGDLTGGLDLLEETIETAEATSRRWEWLFARYMKAVTLARMASGEVSGDWRTLIRNARLIPYLRKARTQAGAELASVRDDAHSAGFEMIVTYCDLEEAKLLMAKGQPDRARPLLERALAFSERNAETEGSTRIRVLLART